jgi:hypothetical protein
VAQGSQAREGSPAGHERRRQGVANRVTCTQTADVTYRFVTRDARQMCGDHKCHLYYRH